MDFLQLAQTERMEQAQRLLADETFSLAAANRYRENGIGNPDAWDYLDQMAGANLADLPPDSLARLKVALAAAFDAPGLADADALTITQSTLQKKSPDRTPRQAFLDIEAIRQGQPNPWLMQHLSPRLETATQMIASRIRQPVAITRLIIGEMGEGKSTLLRLIHHLARKEGAIPVTYTAPQSRIFRPEDMLGALFFAPVLFHACAEYINSKPGKPSITSLLETTKKSEAHPAFRAFVRACQKSKRTKRDATQEAPDDDLDGVVREFIEAMQQWVKNSSNSRCGPINRFIAKHDQGMVSSKFNVMEGTTFILSTINFIRRCQVFPLWLVDEFESYVALNEGRLQVCLGLYREIIDAINHRDPEHDQSSGGLFLFSTYDGLKVIKRYPALEDRLYTANKQFSVNHGSWHMQSFRDGDPKHTVLRMLELYRNAATSGDPTCLAAADHADLITSPGAQELFASILQAKNSVPRNTFKQVAELFDTFEHGDAAFLERLSAFHGPAPEQPASSDDRPPSATPLATVTPDTGVNQAPAQKRSAVDLLLSCVRSRRESAPTDAASAPGPAPYTCEADAIEDTPEPLPPPPAELVIDGNDIAEIDIDDVEAAPGWENHDYGILPSGDGDLPDADVGTPLVAGRPMLTGRAMLDAVAGILVQRDTALLSLSEADIKARLLKASHAGYLMQRFCVLRDQGGNLQDFCHLIGYRPRQISALELEARCGLWIEESGCLSFPGNKASRIWHTYFAMLACLSDDFTLRANQAITRLVSMSDVIAPDNSESEADTPKEKPKGKKKREPRLAITEVRQVTLQPFTSIGQLRHSLYIIAAGQGYIPLDEEIDSLVMNEYQSIMGDMPSPSRNGISFTLAGDASPINTKRYDDAPIDPTVLRRYLACSVG
ncbi:hypothetical protein VRRI112168_02665 [Vreelandella rituensis]|uniref:ATP-binding protein n=1 Tax=Vreelandella rituensis TaxID=2282306 RepID=A0A368UAU6_9GAMM|nr:hypothetical protein [Halomonas rituensis]RCV93647.1 hypothetical protein DU506_00385 [Halomonas rituensis]